MDFWIWQLLGRLFDAVYLLFLRGLVGYNHDGL